ncbi:MAG: hypothetical protein FWG20_00745 [Candidatus Cloacimonetes bacterium]|nr:hypothetical protein [Candidatus Cloacimonadota bacterium]
MLSDGKLFPKVTIRIKDSVSLVGTPREFDIIGTPLKEVEIGAVGIRSIYQNVKTIMTTWRGSVFLDRQFGVDARIIDRPINFAIPELIVNLTEIIEKYEPRVEVVEITFTEAEI